MHAGAGLQKAGGDQADGERDKAGCDEPEHGRQARASCRLAAAHMRHASGQGRKNQGCDHHLDQGEENPGHQAQIIRSGFSALWREGLVRNGAKNYPRNERESDQKRKMAAHGGRFPFNVGEG